jgi:hypothetical protein
MNKETGIIMKEFQVAGSSFDIFKYGFALFNCTNAIMIYDKSGRKRKELLMSDELNKCNIKFLTGESNLIGFNRNNNGIIISNFI